MLICNKTGGISTSGVSSSSRSSSAVSLLVGSYSSSEFAVIFRYYYCHNLTRPEDGLRATWAEEYHRGGLRIGFCVSVLRARMAVYLVRIV
jgi:hypothetical protein